jgi:hypothetical protein
MTSTPPRLTANTGLEVRSTHGVGLDVARISIISNGKLVHSVELSAGEMYVGRGDDATIQLKHPLISRKHTRLYLTPAGYIVEDQGTKNGTFVGGRRVQRHRLVDGDEMAIADFILRYHADGFVPIDDTMPPPEPKKGGMVAGDRGKDSKKSPLEAYMDALKRGGNNATAAIPPAAMARLREQARAKATPRLEIDGAEPIALEKQELILGWSDDCDIKFAGRWVWVGQAVKLRREDLETKLERISFWVPVRVNGDRIKGEVTVKPGDFIQVGKRKLKLLQGDAPF